jgi:hypothetical protein
MKRINLAFLIIIGIELIFVIFFYLFAIPCGSTCDTHSFLNPFGKSSDGLKLCPLMCVRKPSPLFYPFADLLIITVAIYIAFLLLRRIKNN